MHRISTLALSLFLLLASVLGAAEPTTPLRGHPGVADAIRVLDLWLEQQIVHHNLPGLSIAIVFDQELVWSKGYGHSDLENEIPTTPTTVYRIGSITKLFTATAIMRLRDEGKLELDDPAAQHLSWFAVGNPFPDTADITIHQLLTHTSGLPREAAFPYWTDHVFPTSEHIAVALPTQTIKHPPGTTYRYSNLGIALLGQIIEEITGQSWASYVETAILRPLGMNSTSAAPSSELLARRATPYMLRRADDSRGVFDYYDTGALGPAANMVSTVEDLGRFASLHFHDGNASANGVLRANSLREMHRAHFVYPSWKGGRGLGFVISHDGDTSFVSHGGWIGGNRSHFLLVPSEKIAVIAAINADDGNPSPITRQGYEAVAPALREATREPSEPVEEKVDPSWKRYLGHYVDPWGWEYQVLILGRQLVLYGYDYPPDDDVTAGYTRLIPVESSIFRTPDDILVTFELDDDGTVRRIKRRYDYLFPKED